MGSQTLVNRVLCSIEADCPLPVFAFTIDRARILWPRKLRKLLRAEIAAPSGTLAVAAATALLGDALAPTAP